ncbi:MAG: hypothetical protein JWN08_3709 [Frankiales bacterium]|nr:hypothetical protein [Frankiales bacterium]
MRRVLQPLSETPPVPVRRPVFRQTWGDLTMLHWPVDPAVVQPFLPAGTLPDVFEGRTWIGLVPFVMSRVRVLGSPPLPWLSAFPETNVRLYATDEQGRRGVVFRSLEASRLLPVLVAQAAYALPYRWARMSVRHGDGTVAYATSRRWPGPRGVGGRVVVRPGAPVPTDPLTLFLTARWGLFSRLPGGRTAWAPVAHDPWRLHRADLLELSDDLVPAAGLPRPAGTPHVLWSPGVSVRFGRPVLA